MKRKLWIFGTVAVFLPEATYAADRLLVATRIHAAPDFAFFVRRWLGNPIHRAAVLEILASVSLPTCSALPLGRTGGRETDTSLLAAMLFAFESLKLIAFKNFAAPTSDVLLAARGRRWTLARGHLVQQRFPLPARMLADFERVQALIVLRRALEEWSKDPYTERILQDFYRTTLPHAPDDDRIDEILAAWSRGEFFYLQPIVRGGSGDDDPDVDLYPVAPANAAGGAQRGPEKTWIEVLLVDSDEQPVSGAKYRVRLTDGSLREGALDAGGSVRITGIDPGTCQVSFPEIDANEWRYLST